MTAARIEDVSQGFARVAQDFVAVDAKAVAAQEAADAAKQFVPPSSALARPVYQRLRDSVSALDLMSAGGLDEAVRNREATTGDAATITAHIAEAADYCALKSRELLIPAGRYYLDEQIAATQPLAVLGDGPLASRLIWVSGAASSGFRVQPTSRVDQTRFIGLGLETFGVNVGTAILVDYGAFPVISPSGGWRLGQPICAHFSDIMIRGATNTATDGWQRGIDASSVIGMTVRDSKIVGIAVTAGAMPLTEDAVLFRGPGDPIQLVVDGLMVSSYQNGVRAVDAEGVYISKSEFVTVGCGFRSENALGETGFWFMGNHVATVDTAVSIQRNGDGFVKDNLFFGSGPATPLVFIDLTDGSSNIDIEGNSFRRAPSLGQTVTSIRINGGNNNRIGRNYHQIGASQTAVSIGAGTSRTNIETQQFDQEMITPYVDAGTDTVFALHPKYGGGLDAIAMPAEGGEQTHLLIAGATGYPSEWSGPAGGIVRTVTYQAGIAIQTAWQPNAAAVGGNMYQRRRVGGAWQPWLKIVGATI